MEMNLNVIAERQFILWLKNWKDLPSEIAAEDVVSSLNRLNNEVWYKIGRNLKNIVGESYEYPVVFNFNPFPWILICLKNKDKQLLSDIITLYSSILNRLLEIVNQDHDLWEMKIRNCDKSRYSKICVSKYPWSNNVLKAYEKFEKSLPWPTSTNVIEWHKAWSWYVEFLRFKGVDVDMDFKMSNIKDTYKNCIDPYGTLPQFRSMSKEERDFDEYLSEKYRGF